MRRVFWTRRGQQAKDRDGPSHADQRPHARPFADWQQAMTVGGPKEQPIPPDALGDSNAVEVLRAFVVDGGLSISFQRAFDDPSMWGMLFVDIARHVARAFAKEGVCSEAEAIEQIHRIFAAELAAPTDLGMTSELKKRGH